MAFTASCLSSTNLLCFMNFNLSVTFNWIHAASKRRSGWIRPVSEPWTTTGHSQFSLICITNFWNKIATFWDPKTTTAGKSLQGTTILVGCNQWQLRQIRIRPEVELHCRIVFDNHQNIFQSHWRLTWSLPLVLRHVLAFFMSITVPFSSKVFALEAKFFTKTALGRIEDELAPKAKAANLIRKQSNIAQGAFPENWQNLKLSVFSERFQSQFMMDCPSQFQGVHPRIRKFLATRTTKACNF